MPLLSRGQCCCHRAVNEGGPLLGQLESGDSIWMLNQCPVSSSRSWLGCLAASNFREAAHSGQNARYASTSFTGYTSSQARLQTASLLMPGSRSPPSDCIKSDLAALCLVKSHMHMHNGLLGIHANEHSHASAISNIADCHLYTFTTAFCRRPTHVIELKCC